MLLATLLAVCGSLPQDPAPAAKPAPAPTMTERIDALIAKSNAYEHFVARYHFRSKDGDEGDIRLVYRAPDRATFVVETKKTSTFACFAGSTLEMRSTGGPDGALTATIKNIRATQDDRELLRTLLEKAFPKKLRPEDLPNPEELVFTFETGGNCDSLNFSSSTGGPARLQWLDGLRRRPESALVGGSSAPSISYSPCSDVRVIISSDTGFISKVERNTPDGVRVGLELTSIDVDEAPSAEDLGPPPAESGARDDSLAAEADSASSAFNDGRYCLGRVVARLLDDGRVEWSDDVSARIGEIIRHMHDDDMRSMYRAYAGPWLAQFDRQAEWLRNALEQLGAEDHAQRQEFSEKLAKTRAQVDEITKQNCQRLLDTKLPPVKCKARASLSEDLEEIERRVLPEVYAELITKPLLKEFDEKVMKQLEKK
jgi:hypothetical protein